MKAFRNNYGSVVRKIKLRPIELRRHSIIRASGHTFEYVGFGPGNYSTAFPDRQDRVLSDQEELLSQSTRVNVETDKTTPGIVLDPMDSTLTSGWGMKSTRAPKETDSPLKRPCVCLRL